MEGQKKGETNSSANDRSPEMLERLIDLLIELESNEAISPDIDLPIEAAKLSENVREDRQKIELQIEEVRPLIEDIETISPEVEIESFSIELPNLKLPETETTAERTIFEEEPLRSPETWQQQRQQEVRKNFDEDPEKIIATAKAIDALIPLIVELLNSKIDFSKEAIVEAVAPEIDRLIEKRAEEDLQKMGAAISRILPEAIDIEIKNYPKQIAKAIAPEVALAIQEQIRLDRNSISRALGSEMGKAIKNQIEIERDAMVDALYPVIGNTVSKYMVDVVKNINEKVESSLTPEGIKRKIRAKMQGVSEAELILRESVKFQVQAILLIQKASGLIVEEIQSPLLDRKLESDLLAGMLTAIRSFVNDCISLDRTSELNEIEYGDAKIVLEVGGYCYLAAIIKGEPSKQFIENIRETLSRIILQHGETIETYDGDPRTIPSSIQSEISQLLENKTILSQNKKPTALLALLGIILAAICIPWGCSSYDRSVAEKITTAVSQQLDAAPELSVYRLIPQVKDGKLILTGRVSSEYLKQQAFQIAVNIAKAENLGIDNQIVAVDVPLDPTVARAEIQRTAAILNQKQGVAIVTDYRDKILTVRGVVIENRGLEEIKQAFQQIPSVDTIIVQTSPKLPIFDRRIYFETNETTAKTSNVAPILREIAAILQDNPQLHLNIIGHADSSGETSRNQQLKEKRANNIKIALAELGIEVDRLHTITSNQLPPRIIGGNSLALSRCVRFEIFIKKGNGS